MDIQSIKIEKPEDVNIILGQSHFIKTVEDIYEVLISSMPGIKFGFAFNESSGPCLVRYEGNDDELTELAKKNAMSIGTGHSFIIMLRNAYPINVMNALKNVQEITAIYCATANTVEVIIADNGKGRGILGVIDGLKPCGVEQEKDRSDRRALLRRFGYKLA